MKNKGKHIACVYCAYMQWHNNMINKSPIWLQISSYPCTNNGQPARFVQSHSAIINILVPGVI